MKGTDQPYAMKKLKKSKMVEKDQVQHVRAEREALADAERTYDDNPWVTRLYYSFQDAHYLYLIMEFVPGMYEEIYQLYIYLYINIYLSRYKHISIKTYI